MTDTTRDMSIPGSSETKAADPRLWTIRDVSAFLSVPVGTIYQWRVRREGPPAMRMGRHLRYDPEAVRRWASSQERAC